MLDLFPRKLESEQFHARFIAIGRSANDANKLVEVGERDEKTFQCLGAFLGFLQFETRPAEDDLAAMIDVSLVRFLERQQLRPAVIDRQHVDRERALHRGVLVKIVDNDLRIPVAF